VELVDSKKKLLAGPEIIARHAEVHASKVGKPVYAILGAISAELTRPSADVAQVGNTVFIAHRAKGENRDKMVGRALNLDVGKNFMENAIKYFELLQRKGITTYMAYFTGKEFVNGFKTFQRALKKLNADWEIAIQNAEGTNQWRVYVKIGKQPIIRD
jgi:hypothetical protein